MEIDESDFENYTSCYVHVRDFVAFSIEITIDISPNLTADFCFRDNRYLLVGMEINDVSNELPPNYRVTTKVTKHFTIVTFIDNVTDETLNQCTLEQHMFLQIYRDVNNKIVQIVVYEDYNPIDLIDRFSELNSNLTVNNITKQSVA
jgi:hypothetical protein